MVRWSGSRLVLLVVWMSACGSPALELTPSSSSSSSEVGDPVSIERVGGYSHLTLRMLFWWQGLSNLRTEHGIDLYRVEYRTVAPDERVVVASGLVGVPRSRESLRGVVSWQHGTASLRSQAPSSLAVRSVRAPSELRAE